ncbi:toll/interleukin-1 receptor domain-containing protein [Oscillibacter ruminantium]|uniref:toll/interleukin-1 receptor domain-containing protein n=1 Tax=Oscillibacter ruminantium TaxID=1263547 RepID=UPI00331974AB
MIFISHAWVNRMPDIRVLSFVDYLRKNGYDAQCDVMLQQQQTAISFPEMMATSLATAEKIIVVLSETYKKKADGFEGGVGEEYRYIIGDFSQRTNRYILVSFGGRGSDIIPDFLRGRDIVDLKADKKNGYRELFSKLSSTNKYQFAEVADAISAPEPQGIPDFEQQSESASSKYGVNLLSMKPVLTDASRKAFMKDTYSKVLSGISEIAQEICSKNDLIEITKDEVDNNTSTFEVYANGKFQIGVQIWIGNQFGGSYYIFVSQGTIGSKSSFSEMIDCKEDNGKLVLKPTMQIFGQPQYLSSEMLVKNIWERFFEPYL